MVNLMRKHQQTLLVFVTVVIIVCFAWFYADPGHGGFGKEIPVGIIYDRPVRHAEYERGARRIQLCAMLGMHELTNALTGDRRSEPQEAQTNAVFNVYVLRHECDELGLNPTDDEVFNEIKKMPVFQSNGAFDSSRYDMIVTNMGSMGFDAGDLQDVVRDNLRFQKVNALLSTTLAASPASLREAFEQMNQKVEVSVVRLKQEEVAKGVQVTDEDLKKAFEERKEGLKTDEMRRVKVVAFVLNDEQKKLAGPVKAEAFQKLLDQTQAFSVAMTQKDAKLDDVAKQFNVQVKEVADFAAGAPPADLGQSPEVAEAVFAKLTLEQPNSDPIQTANGYYVVQLTGITAAHPLTFDEAKPKLAEALKTERVTETMTLKGAELRKKLDEELKAGKTFADAATAAGFTAETLPAFSGKEPLKPDVAGGMQIADAAQELTAGQLSEVIPVPGGSAIARVEKRHPIDEAEFAKEKSKLAENLIKFETRQSFPMWLTERRKAANLQTKVGG